MDPAADLLRVGLRVGDRVRFRRVEGGHWVEGTVKGRERDGSIALHDVRGAARSITLERLEVLRRSSRGRPVWRPVAVIAANDEQLGLW